ncbi:SAM-dependent methyltransferase [Streptomyces sp. SID3212]|uniref:SAM-dependent methyltransferase n=1 Tax=unclassified Streptomyces TaxID=2593676 RepID=UPI00136A869E|nr:SAM-dependent methyltransferase [Streptomyces sp. SID3212]MYV54699.1 methyltransferase domain-containing protein [Streptomyces sp. SID3212]
MTGASTPADYFDGMYRGASDPWDLAGRWYERRKYGLTVASLPRRRYRSAFEPGCSVGVLTSLLAPRCDRLLATDRVPAAVRAAADRTRGLPQVRVERLTVPAQWPEGRFDLIVLSELLYYFDDIALREILDRTVESLEPGGTLVTAHWNHPVAEHLRTGTELAPLLASVPELQPLTDHRDPDFVLHTFARRHPDGRPVLSPAAEEGLV